MMNIHKLISDVIETLESACPGTPILSEDKGNIISSLQTEIAKTNRAIVVGTNGFTPHNTEPGLSESGTWGTLTIVVSIFECVPYNRQSNSAPKLYDLAAVVASTLNLAASEGMDDFLHIANISPVNDLGEGVISCEVSFSTKATL